MAAPTPSPRAPKAGHGVIPAEWPAQAADTIVDTIAKVRDRTTKPALIAARTLVYGLVVAVVGLIAFFLTLVLIMRVLVNYGAPVWAVYATFGIVFTATGFYLLRRANKPTPAPDA